ncbi:DUF4129 domain-containing protein [Gracilimonas mengyeensis]|nr:DUF4129 domain-containing protein [Gracilimonas mengyeensis]
MNSKTLSTHLLLQIILSLMLSATAFAQADSAPLPTDSSQVDVRTAPPETLEAITSDPVFDYQEIPQNPESLWDRIVLWLIQAIGYLFEQPWANTLIRIIFFIIFGLMIIGLINQIMGGNIRSAFSGNKAGEKVMPGFTQSNPQKTNYDQLLEQAIADNNYHDAVRLLYLKALQQLSSKSIITWKSDKTNRDYLQEIDTHPSKSPFRDLTLYYEYVEYGDFEIDQLEFKKVQTIYRKFKNTLG